MRRANNVAKQIDILRTKEPPATLEMALLPKMSSQFFAQTLIFVSAILLVFCGVYLWRTSFRSPASVDLSFKNSDISVWKALGGNWTASDAGIRNDSQEKGAKLVSGDLNWKDYEVDADVQLLRTAGDAGIIIRSGGEARGIDSYNGYYIGLRVDPSNIFIGRADQGYFEYAMGKMPGGVHNLAWYHMHISAVGCEITGIVSNSSTGESARVSMKEPSCATQGRIGLRSFIAGAVWKNIRVRSVEPSETKRLARLLVAFCLTVLVLLLFLSIYLKVEDWRLKAVLEERTRVAREIHDTLSQGFSAIALQLESIVREPDSAFASNQNIELALNMARQSRKEAHIMMEALRNLSSELSLPEIIANAALVKLRPKRIELSLSTQNSIPRFSADVETQLFRISQEAISNAVQHSGGNEITMDFSFTNRTLTMKIRDNGSGFSLENGLGIEEGHYGVIGMRERASAINAAFALTSDNLGTSIEVSVPLVGFTGGRFHSFLKTRIFHFCIDYLRLVSGRRS